MFVCLRVCGRLLLGDGGVYFLSTNNVFGAVNTRHIAGMRLTHAPFYLIADDGTVAVVAEEKHGGLRKH